MPLHFLHMHETILEHRFGERADAISHRVERVNWRLHVGRKGGYGRVRTFTACGRRPSMSSSIQSSPTVILAPASRKDCNTASMMSARVFLS